MSTSNVNNKSVQRAIRFENDQFDAVNAVRGDVTFAMWVKRAVQMRLDAGEVQSNSVIPTTTNNTTKNGILTWSKNRSELRALAIELTEKDNSAKVVADHFNALGYLNRTGEPFKRHNIKTLLDYKGDATKPTIKL